MINSKPWLVVGYSNTLMMRTPSLVFKTRSEAEALAKALNKISSTITYKVVFDESQILIA
jgi:hypothetical protein